MQPSVLAFGEILFDVFDGQACIGGASFNFAAHFSRLGGEIFVSNLNCRMQRIFGLFGLNSITERNSKIDMIVNEED